MTVVKATLTITAPSVSMTYGGPIPTFTPTYNPANPVGVTTPPTCTTTATTTSPVSATTYPITCSGAVAPAYAISYVAGALTITPKAASVTPNAATKPYGAVDPTLTGTLTGFLASDGVTATYTRTPGTAVGTYTISATLAPAAVLGNYTITYNTASFVITRANASVTPNGLTKVYGTADPTLTGTLSGFVPSDGVTATYTRTPGTAVGTYTISATLAPASVLGNYNITYNTAPFVITRATASVTPNAVTKVWGQADPVLTGTLAGFLPSDGVTATYTRVAGTAVGTYLISATLAPAAVLGNYNIAYNTALLTITNAIQLTPASLTFGVQNVNSTSPTQTVTLRNLGGARLTTIAIAFAGANAGDFVRGGGGGGSCGTTLAVAATCTINVRFRPTAGGVRTANLSVTSAGGNSGTTALTGTGNAAVAGVSPVTTAVAPQDFGSVTRGQVSAPFTVTVTNSGNSALTFNAANGFTLGGANPTQFRLTTGGLCANGGTLPALGTCTITVSFAPAAATARNTKNATVTIRSNATNGNQFVYVRGTAQ